MKWLTEEPVMPEQCKTCIFRDGNPMQLRPRRLAEIQTYLLQGTVHLCHTPKTKKRACRGGRDFQLTIWHRLGILEAPTDAALDEAIEAHAISEPETGRRWR